MLLGALDRGAMLIAGSEEPGRTRDAVARAVRALLAGLAKGEPSTSDPGLRRRVRRAAHRDLGEDGRRDS